MKNIKMLLIALLFGATAYGQGLGSIGANGTSNYTTTNMHNVNAQGVAKSFQKDTLSNGDTGYVYIWVGQGFDQNFELLTTTITGTVATTSNILYGYNNYGQPLTAAQVATVTGTAITGNTTYCAGCVGASSTTVPGSSKKYTWQVPRSAGALYDNYFIRTIQTGTCTATYSGKLSTQR